MPKYEVTADSWLDQPDARSDTGFAPKYIKKGERVSYDGIPGTSLKPLDAAAHKAVEKAQAARPKPDDELKAAKERIAALEAQLKAKPDAAKAA